jgi:O-antigen/teichoic acid export membrane protein
LKALLNLAQVVFQMYGAMSLLLLPHAASTSAKRGVTGSEVLGRRVMWIFGAGSVLYWVFVSGFRHQVLNVLYRGNYTEVAPLIPWLGVACVLWGAAQGPGIALRGANSPKTVFWAYLGGSVVTLVVGIPACYAFGIRGVAAALILSSATALVISARLLRRQSLPRTSAAVEQATAA